MGSGKGAVDTRERSRLRPNVLLALDHQAEPLANTERRARGIATILFNYGRLLGGASGGADIVGP